MKLLARSHVWWPGLSQDIENFCKQCNSCALVNFAPRNELKPWPPTKEPFERIFIDFFELEKVSYLIVVDSFSKWIGVYPMTTNDAKAVCEQLFSVFVIWGLPGSIVADNGPPFGS